MRRVNRNHLAGHQPVEQHADTSEMLLDRGRLHALAQALDVLSDVDRLDLIERADPAHVAPAQKRGGRAPVRGARVRVADIDREEFEEAGARPLLCPGDERRQRNPPPPASVPYDRELTHAGRYHRPGPNTRT